MPYVKTIDRNQMYMTSLDMMVDPDSIARIIDAFVDSLDLTGRVSQTPIHHQKAGLLIPRGHCSSCTCMATGITCALQENSRKPAM